MAKSPGAYPPEFRRKICELVRAGRKPREIAAEFKISNQTVANWLKDTDPDRPPGRDLTCDERTELGKLRREVKRLKLEAEILSKAAAWFARETNAIPMR